MAALVPDGVLVLQGGERVWRLAVEVERTDGVARLAEPGGELEDYAAGAGRARYAAGLLFAATRSCAPPWPKRSGRRGDGADAGELLPNRK